MKGYGGGMDNEKDNWGALTRGDRGRSHSTCSGGCGDDSSDDNSHDTLAIGIWRWWEGYGYGD